MTELNTEVEATKGAKIQLQVSDMTRTKSASGSISYHCGDAVARALQGLSLPFVKQLAVEALGIDTAKYDHLNPGQQRMTLGNVMRNMLRRDESLIDKFNEVLTGVTAAHEEATKEEREAAEAEKLAKAKAAADAKEEKEKEKQRKADERAQKKADAEAEKQRKADERAQAKADREAEKKRKADERQAEKDRKTQEKADAAAAKAAAAE